MTDETKLPEKEIGNETPENGNETITPEKNTESETPEKTTENKTPKKKPRMPVKATGFKTAVQANGKLAILVEQNAVSDAGKKTDVRVLSGITARAKRVSDDGEKTGVRVAESVDENNLVTKVNEALRFTSAPVFREKDGKTVFDKRFSVETEQHGVWNLSELYDTSLPALYDDPRCVGEKKACADALGLRGAIESRVFGETFPDDTLHIQTAHLVMDVDGLITPYIGMITAVLNRINPRIQGYQDANPKNDIEGNERLHDFIGKMNLGLDYKTFSENQGGSQEQAEWFETAEKMQYFGSEFFFDKTAGNDEEDKKRLAAAHKKKIYYILWLLSYIRQSLVHQNSGSMLFRLEKARKKKDPDMKAWKNFYHTEMENNGYLHDITSEKTLLKARKEAVKVLDGIFARKIKQFREEFWEHSRVNIGILANVYDYTYYQNLGKDDSCNAPYLKLLSDFYRFSETKEQRCEGYSIRTVREFLLKKDASGDLRKELRTSFTNQQDFMSKRHKLNTILDMIIWNYYQEEDRKTVLLKKLRTVSVPKGKRLPDSPAELKRQSIYRAEAAAVWESEQERIREAVNRVSHVDEYKTYSISDAATKAFEDKMNETNAGFSRFSKLLYLMTLFLDGKEINTMLTQLIHKFDSITEFRDAADEMLEKGLLKPEQKIGFQNEYRFFVKSREIARELRVVNSLARMTGKKEAFTGKDGKPQKPHLPGGRAALTDAAALLGFDGVPEELEKFLNEQFSASSGTQTEKKTGFRNFILNNVVKNARFRYLVRYGNPGALTTLGHNETVMGFLLRQLPETQLLRYAEHCGLPVSLKPAPGRKRSDKELALLADKLAKLLIKVRFLNYRDEASAQEARNDPEKQKTLERDKSVVSLYLTMLYLLVKNVIHVNYRYVIAFNRLERDMSLIPETRGKDNYKLLTDRYLDTEKEYGAVTVRFRGYLKQDRNQFSKDQIKKFRNYVEHLDITHTLCEYAGEIQNPTSYFAIYHYCMQRELKLIDQNSYPSYGKDIVKQLCYPFGYNLPRYKNLSTEALFDYEHPVPDADAGTKRTEAVPDVLYHVTAKKNLENIRAKGLRVKETNGVPSPYLRKIGSEPEAFLRLRTAEQSSNPAKPKKNGRETVVLTIRAKEMREAGIPFYREKDGSYLVRSVDVNYIEFPQNT